MATQNPGPPPNNVRYVDVMNQFQDGDLMLWRANYLTSEVFEFLDGSFYSHAAVIAKWGKRWMVLQAEEHIEAVPLSVTIASYPGRVDWYRLKREMIPDPDAFVARMLEEARSDLGLPFGITDLLASFWNQIRHITMPNVDKARAMYCSEYVEHCFRTAGLSLTDQPDSATLPQMVADSRYVEYVATVEHDPKDKNPDDRTDDDAKPD